LFIDAIQYDGRIGETTAEKSSDFSGGLWAIAAGSVKMYESHQSGSLMKSIRDDSVFLWFDLCFPVGKPNAVEHYSELSHDGCNFHNHASLHSRDSPCNLCE
jgi:hypothetical protein